MCWIAAPSSPTEPERFGLTRQDVSDPNFSDPCFLVMHPKGMLLFDTGLTDSHVGRPIYENMMGYEGQLKFTTLRASWPISASPRR